MPVYETFVTRLLRIYHGRDSVSAEHPPTITAKQLDYLCDVGLGPIAFAVYGDALRATDPAGFSTLQSADLTVRVLYSQLEKATRELVAESLGVGVTPVLLKGISTAYELYAPRHLRLMGDVDILVRPSEVDQTMATLSDLGYEVSGEAWQMYYDKGHHHLPAARNPMTGVTVEVHTALLPAGLPIAAEPVFQPNNVETQKLGFDYKGIRAARFTPEYQFVFTIAHWGIDGNWAVNLTSINDAIHVLRRYESRINWSMLFDWLDSSPCLYTNVAALMNYLVETDIVAIPPQFRDVLKSSNGQIQPRTAKTLCWLLHNYPFNAREIRHDRYAIARARIVWRDLTRPGHRDVLIPVSFLRALLRYIHVGKYNPLGWFLNSYRYLARQFASGR